MLFLKVVGEQVKDDPVKDGVKNIEDIINNGTAFTSDDADIIDQFIDKYKDNDGFIIGVKDLSWFIPLELSIVEVKDISPKIKEKGKQFLRL